ncbi:transposase, partial [Porphyromonas gingivalis]
LIHCIIGSYFVYLSIKNSIILLPWHTNPRIPMSM